MIRTHKLLAKIFGRFLTITMKYNNKFRIIPKKRPIIFAYRKKINNSQFDAFQNRLTCSFQFELQIEDAMLMFDKQTNRHRGEWKKNFLLPGTNRSGQQ